MSTATADASTAAPAGKGKKKLMIIIVAVLLVLGLAGGGAMVMMKKKSADAEESADGEERAPTKAHATPDKSHPPTYVALDPFTVNLADKDSERYAQVAVTLEVDDPKFAEQMKGYMPSIRNAILLILAHKSSAELLELAGKKALAAEIMREAVRPMGIEIEPEDAEADDEDSGAKKKKKKKKAAVHNPVTHVHFANFIIQ